MDPHPVRLRASLPTTTLPMVSLRHAYELPPPYSVGRCPSCHDSRHGIPTTPSSVSATELMRRVKLAAAVTKASSLSDVDRSKSMQFWSESDSESGKEKTMRLSSCLKLEVSHVDHVKTGSILTVPSSWFLPSIFASTPTLITRGRRSISIHETTANSSI